MKTTTMGSAGTLGAAIEHFGGEVRRFFEAIAAGAQASREYERLSRYSTPELAREGLTRDQIARSVLERNFR